MIQAQAIVSDIFGQFLGLFQSPLIGIKFSLEHKNLMNLFMTTTIDFRLFLNSGLFSDVDSTQVAFNSMFINGLNEDLSLLVKRTRMEWKIMSTPDVVHLVNQLFPTLDESPKKKNAKILHLQLK